MSDNPFALSNIQEGGATAPANDNPFSLAAIERDQGQDLRNNLRGAVTINPDHAARAAHLAKQYPVPTDVLARNLQDVEMQAAVDAADKRLQTSPILAKAMRDGKSWLAPQAHDDVGPLADVEQFFRDTGGSVKAGVFNASKGAAGVFRAGAEFVAPVLDFMEGATDLGGNPLRRLAEGFAMQAEAASGSAKAAAPKTTGIVSSGFQSGIQSLTQNTMMLPLAFLPGGQGAALGGMTAFTGGQSYQDAREKGLPMSQALPFAASQAAIEYATEKLPLGQLIGDVKAGTPFFQMLAKQIALEVPGEQVATILQDLNEWAVLNPEKPFSSYLEERPSAAAQTLVATIVGTGGNVAVVKGIESVVTRAVNGSRQIQDAERMSDGLQTAMQAAAASKLRERNPETFKQLVQAMADESGGDVASVFIDAQVLMQSGVNVAEVLPSAAEQMDAALATGGSVEVAIGDVLAAAPGTPLEQVFLQNARGTADGLSLAEAQQSFEQADQWKQEADRVMAEAQDQQAWQADADAVKTTILDQLNAAGRFTPDVNDSYASFVSSFFSVMAARQGITPQEMYARYPLRVGAQVQGGQVLNSGSPTNEATGAADFQTGTPVRFPYLRNTAGVRQFDTGEFGTDIEPVGRYLLFNEGRKTPDSNDRVQWESGEVQFNAPLVVESDNWKQNLSSQFGGAKGQALTDAVRAAGYDAIVTRDKYGIDEIVDLTDDQLKQSPAPFDGPETGSTPIGDATTVEVDGKTRPALNSNGQPIHPTLEGVRNFWRWFGDSKVVDAEGRPLVVYHGTRAQFQEFDYGRIGQQGRAEGAGFYFTTNREVASGYGEPMEVYLAIQKPMAYDAKGFSPSVLQKIVKQVAEREAAAEGMEIGDGFLSNYGDTYSDGVPAVVKEAAKLIASDETAIDQLSGIVGSGVSPEYVNAATIAVTGFDGVTADGFSNAGGDVENRIFVALTPAQIKSATSNSGAFDGQDANILRQGSQRFSEDNRLSNLNPNGASWQRIRENNPALKGKSPDDMVTVYRATIGATIRPDDFVAVDKSTLRTELKNVRARDGKAAKIIEQQVRVRDLLMGNDASEFVYYPDEQLNQQARGTFSPSQLAIVLNENADLSTFLHESGHFFLEVMADLASQPNAPADVQADMGALLEWFGVKGDSAPVTPLPVDPVPNRLQLNAEGIRNLLVGQPPGAESNGVVSLEPFLGVFSEVAGAVSDPQVLQSVVASIPVDVVDMLASQQFSADSVLNDEAMLKKAFSITGDGDVSIPVEAARKLLSLVNVVAARSAERAGVTDVSGATGESDSAVGTGEKGGHSGSKDYVRQQEFTSALAKWNSMTLDEKRVHHETFAESFEAYLLEGRAPSTELQGLFRKFRSWMLNVYKSLTQFMRGRDLKLSAEVRQVFDRMLATDEQIRQAEETAGLLPDVDATADATEKLQARSLRDLKWTVGARSKAIKALQKQAAELRKAVESEVRAEVDAMPEFRAQAELKKLKKPTDMELATVADSFGYESPDAMLKAIADVGKKADVIEGLTDQRMLERHGDLIDQRAIEEAANEAVHNEARARSLATELRSQAEMLNPREDTGRTASNGRAITVNALTEAAKQFAQNVVARRRVADLRKTAAQHRATEARAGKRWQEATAAGNTQDAVAAKRDQLLNNYTVKAALEAQAEVKKIEDFFRRVTKGSNEKLVERGRDPDVVNAARAVLATYGVAPRLEKAATEYLDVVARTDPAMHAALQPSVQGALQSAKPVGDLTMEELRGLADEIRAMWHLAKRSRQMEIDGNMLDIEDAADELQARMQEIGVPDSMPGDTRAVTASEKRARWLQHAGSLLRRAEQWAEGMDGKFGGPFLRLVFQPVKLAADRYRADRVKYRKAYQALVDAVAPAITKGPIAAPELGYTFGEGPRGIGHTELLHAILHTGNESNKRKLLLGRGWATENADGTLNTSKWDAFIQRMHDEDVLTKAHYDFAQGVWDLLEQTKPLAQKTHRDVFGRYFAEVTADEFDTPFGKYKGGYVPAQADPEIVQDADLRKLAEAENENMSYSFPTTNKGFTKGRVEYNRPLKLDLRSIGQHLDKVLLFSHMEPAVRDVNKLLSQKGVSYSLGRIDPTIYAGMLTPWLKRSARQIVETPILGDGGISRVASAARSRAGMALMFANVSNTLQQVTGFATAFAKIKADGLPSHMTRATAQFIASPRAFARNVAAASPFMDNRMANEVSAINDAMDDILLDQSLYEKTQAWTLKHAYFLQTAMANTMEPIIWTAGYNGALQKGMSETDAARYADGLVRQTQGSTLPEDVSRIETGPAYARVFTQFTGYFNMMANTNTTALKQIAQEQGLRKGAGKALLVLTAGMLVPLWVAEAIAQAMRGGPEDEDDDGYLDDWLAAVFGMGTIKGSLAMVPFVGQLANAGINRMNSNPADDKISMSPAVSLLESGVGVPKLVYQAMTDPDKINARNAVRDVASAISITTGLPAYAIARPLGYLAGVEQGRIDPTSEIDAARGMLTGSASPDSKN